MSSKTVERARKLQRQLETGTTEHAVPAAEQLDAARPEDEKTGLVVGLKALSRSTGQLFVRYEAAEAKLARELGEDQATRGGRDQVAGRVRQSLSGLGGAVEQSYGRATAEALALTGTTPSAPEQLVTTGQRFLAVSSPMPELPAPKQRWSAPDVAAARADIEAQVGELVVALRETSREERETQSARQERDEAREAWKEEATLLTQLARAALRKQGLHKQASELLPTISSIRDVEVEEEQPTPAHPGAPEA